eukprot:CAMPEP_0115879508 /NCGR_PEP_ID=MMETSP0287-20121206/27359_1 /TAXON_ID=412157 /ORGANISM="Chrysochromulina rotalis, Strain UIO044" /LENGTH=57 /DNA_ID=CAMNT_0003335225 /DNA_START=21 /DNA_END=191 /DNA_ORIENTATION=+
MRPPPSAALKTSPCHRKASRFARRRRLRLQVEALRPEHHELGQAQAAQLHYLKGQRA